MCRCQEGAHTTDGRGSILRNWWRERLIALLFDDWEEDDGEVDSKKVSEVGTSEDIATSVCNGCSTCGSSGDVHVLMICL